MARNTDSPKDVLLALMNEELLTLKEFLSVLHQERDAIISFSLEEVIRQNNRKEEVIRRLEYIQKEQEQVRGRSNAPPDVTESMERIQEMKGKVQKAAAEVRKALGRNMALLSFSVDHVRCSIGKIINLASQPGYGQKMVSKPAFISTEA